MKILSIGNSFSCDAQRYLSRLAGQYGYDIKSVNLYIGGCSLQRHYENMINDAAEYGLEVNGERTDRHVSIKDALLSDGWDVVTLQQASHYSAKYETYTPYIEELAKYVRELCPQARIFIHQTWAYEADSDKLHNVAGFETPEEMFDLVRASYEKAMDAIGADGLIPCGLAMLTANRIYGIKVHRDTFHASYGTGRYILALCWCKALLGADISKDVFADLDESMSDEERGAAIKAVNRAFGNL